MSVSSARTPSRLPNVPKAKAPAAKPEPAKVDAAKAKAAPAAKPAASKAEVAKPAAAALIGGALGLSGLYFDVVVLFAALPTASSAYILAMRMGGDGRSVAWLISATTLASMVTLPVWAGWLAGRAS